MKRKLFLDSIMILLGSLQQSIILANKLNLTDLNIHAENFYRDLLNKILGLSLVNINIDETNAAAVDLGDTSARIAIQVTSSATAAKVKKTAGAFDRHCLSEKYDRLVILNVGKTNSYRSAIIGAVGGIQVSTKDDVWSVDWLLKAIHDLDLPKIESVCKFLETELSLVHRQRNSREVETFNLLIYSLSEDEERSGQGKFLEDPDPERKLHARFSDHAQMLERQYQDLYVEYGASLEQVLDQADLGHVRVRRLALHLRYMSDVVLNQHNGDARLALDSLIETFRVRLDLNKEYDESAIRFFLVHQLISCNVFPNPVSASA